MYTEPRLEIRWPTRIDVRGKDDWDVLATGVRITGLIAIHRGVKIPLDKHRSPSHPAMPAVCAVRVPFVADKQHAIRLYHLIAHPLHEIHPRTKRELVNP